MNPVEALTTWLTQEGKGEIEVDAVEQLLGIAPHRPEFQLQQQVKKQIDAIPAMASPEFAALVMERMKEVDETGAPVNYPTTTKTDTPEGLGLAMRYVASAIQSEIKSNSYETVEEVKEFLADEVSWRSESRQHQEAYAAEEADAAQAEAMAEEVRAYSEAHPEFVSLILAHPEFAQQVTADYAKGGTIEEAFEKVGRRLTVSIEKELPNTTLGGLSDVQLEQSLNIEVVDHREAEQYIESGESGPVDPFTAGIDQLVVDEEGNLDIEALRGGGGSYEAEVADGVKRGLEMREAEKTDHAAAVVREVIGRDQTQTLGDFLAEEGIEVE